MSYSRVTWEDRIKIKVLYQEGLSLSKIAGRIGKHKSTISRELKRNTGKRGYRPKQAHSLAKERATKRQYPYKLKPKVIAEIQKKLALKWSPEQISNRLKKEGIASISTETIYKFILKDKKENGLLWKNLRRSSRTRKHRFPNEERRGKIKNPTSITKRSKAANNRSRIGHWERDTMIGLNRKTGILVITDRKTRYNKFIKLNRKKAHDVTKATIKALEGLPVYSITNDRGLEFADHKNCSSKLGIKIYFCDPYTSSQRGTNENRIGILRQYLPKRTDLSKVSNQKIKKIEFEINNRPMKCLDWQTPYEIMFKKRCAKKL